MEAHCTGDCGWSVEIESVTDSDFPYRCRECGADTAVEREGHDLAGAETKTDKV